MFFSCYKNHDITPFGNKTRPTTPNLISKKAQYAQYFQIIIYTSDNQNAKKLHPSKLRLVSIVF